MTTHTIEIEGLPEGWEAVAYRKVKPGESYYYAGQIYSTNEHMQCIGGEHLIVQKKTKPRRIVLEETEEETDRNPRQGFNIGDTHILIASNKIWRIKEE